MQICKKSVPFALILILCSNVFLFAQLSVPTVSAPTISGPTAPSIPSMGSYFNGSTTSTTTTTSSTPNQEETQSSEESEAGLDLTADALTALSGLFGADTNMLGTDSMTDIYSLLEDYLNPDQNGIVNNLVFEQILTKLEDIEAKLETTEKSQAVLSFNIVNSKTSEISNLLAKAQNISIGNKNTNGSFLVSGTIVQNPKNSSENETFYMDFTPVNTHTYEVAFTVHTNSENSILKEMSSHGPYKATKTANYTTMSIFGPTYYLDFVLSLN